MAIEIKHKFQSAKVDGPDSTVVQPSNWNDNHDLKLAAGKVLGRDSSGAGSVQELPLAFDATLQSMIPPSGTTAQRPATPSAGMIRYNTTTSQLEMYKGGAWGSIGGSAFVGASAPASPQPGDLWYNTSTGQLVSYNGTSWVLSSANAAVVSLTGDGATTSFALGVDPISKNNTSVFVAGVYQAKSTYSISGTSIVFSAAPPAGVTIDVNLLAAVALNMPALGWSQTWQNMAASRAFAATYQNTTGRPIQVMARLGATSTDQQFQVSSDNVNWVAVCIVPASGRAEVSVVIPNDHYYRVTGAGTVDTWAELR